MKTPPLNASAGKAGLKLPVSIRVGVCAADPVPGDVAGRAYFA